MGLPCHLPPSKMMIGESRQPLHPTVRIPPLWPSLDDPADEFSYPYDADHSAVATAASPYALQDIISSLRHHQADPDSDGPDSPVDLYTSDHFRMYEFKVRRCARGKSHDWTECPYAHPGEKARRRDPRRHGYSGAACPDFRSGHCPKGDACELAHGVFECWLHPSRYRTQPCKDGLNCTRRVCFFAHTTDQLRVVPGQQSPRSVESLSSSPPASPLSLSLSRSPFGADPVAEMVVSLRNLQLDKVKSMPRGGSISGSPRGSRIRPGFYSMPATPTQSTTPTARGIGYLDSWESGYEEEPAMERVESGRGLRAKMFEKLSNESSLDTVRPESDPDFWWVSDLVK